MRNDGKCYTRTENKIYEYNNVCEEHFIQKTLLPDILINKYIHCHMKWGHTYVIKRFHVKGKQGYF